MLKLNADDTIKNVISQIDQYKSDVKDKIQKSVSDSMLEALPTINTMYDAHINSCSSLMQEPYSKPNLYVIQRGNTAFLVANGEDVAFIEYGTGIVGLNNKHPEPLKKGVPITGVWQYFYPSPYKEKVQGIQGWFHKHYFHTGTPAGKQLYEATDLIKKSIYSKLTRGSR